MVAKAACCYGIVTEGDAKNDDKEVGFMGGFSELTKRFDNIRDYMRDFFVYGYKSRADFTKKSSRTYDNAKRRVESYLGKYMKWDYIGKNKFSFVSIDCGSIPVNPLYAAWKSKSFTNNDIMLHFYILDALKDGPMKVTSLTDHASEKSLAAFDAQTVRNKLNEYTALGLLKKEASGKAYAYSLDSAPVPHLDKLLSGVKFFQGAAPFGEIGSYILDNENETNDCFSFKHYYIAHTLEDIALETFLSAIKQNKAATFENFSERSQRSVIIYGLPLKILVSAGTGRRFVCVYLPGTKRFNAYRLDYIKSISLDEEEMEGAKAIASKLDRNLPKAWGVTFGGGNKRSEVVKIKLYIDEHKEQYIIERIMREGQGGVLERGQDGSFVFTKEVFDNSDMGPWIKSFIGRIEGLESNSGYAAKRFYEDMQAMADMYGIYTDGREDGNGTVL